MTKPQPQPGILQNELYVGGKSTVSGVTDILKLSSNENPDGPSPLAMAALQDTAAGLHRYPSGDHADLRRALADVHGLDYDRIICGCGSDEVISFITQAYCGPGAEVIHTEHGFLMYKIYATAAGATCVSVPERDRYVDVDAILAAVTDKTSIIFIANPGNPTGTRIPDADLERLIGAVRPDVLVVLDGAYAEYVGGWDGCAGMVDANDNVVMLRTLSKLYGLGGLRVGWGYGPQHVIDVLNRVRGPFNLSVPALAAGTAAVRDTDFVAGCLHQNSQCRAWLANELAKLGVPSDPSDANFILARFYDAATAAACDQFMQTRGIIARQVGSYGLPQCLRITVPNMDGCRRVVAAVAEFKGQVNQ